MVVTLARSIFANHASSILTNATAADDQLPRVSAGVFDRFSPVSSHYYHNAIALSLLVAADRHVPVASAGRDCTERSEDNSRISQSLATVHRFHSLLSCPLLSAFLTFTHNSVEWQCDQFH